MIQLEKLPSNILEKIPEAQKVLASDEDVIFAYLFGGLARGNVKPLSDIDIAVYLKPVEDFAKYKLDLFGRLADALGTAELDLVLLNTTPISLAGRVLQNKQVVMDKEPEKRHAYESVTLREFFDFRIQEETYFARRYGRGR